MEKKRLEGVMERVKQQLNEVNAFDGNDEQADEED
jgi:C4-type Zn-finger protein